MTWSLTLAGLPRAAANAKPHAYNQKVQKMKDRSKIWVLTGKQFEGSGQLKEQKHCSRPFRKTQSNTRNLKASMEHGPRRH